MDERCPKCGTVMEFGMWPFCDSPGGHGAPRGFVHNASVHESERAVVWRNPQTGEVRYPGRNDAPIPERYQSQGFQRHELGSLAAIHQFEKQQNVRSEIAWYDRGSGRGADE